ncbi:MAG: hypothetical protein RL030_1315 [Pseudomonadota bacterium]
MMDVLLSLALGIGLAAAVGLRVFIPLLVVAVAAYFGKIPLAPAFSWLASLPAIAMLGIAAVVEVAGYYIPGVDNVLDTIAAPMALIAGTFVVAAPLWDLPPLFTWTAAILAGGGAAGLTHGVTSLLRAKSTVTTGGLANPVIATGELGGSLMLSVLALAVPVFALIVLALVLFWAYRLIRRLTRRLAPSQG